jgi:hypothetical protein
MFTTIKKYVGFRLKLGQGKSDESRQNIFLSRMKKMVHSSVASNCYRNQIMREIFWSFNHIYKDDLEAKIFFQFWSNICSARLTFIF